MSNGADGPVLFTSTGTKNPRRAGGRGEADVTHVFWTLSLSELFYL